MLELRLTQHPAKRNRHTVEIALEGDGARRTAESTFAFALSSQDEEALRWYLEEFLQYPQEPAPTIAARIEERLAAIGRELFEAVFESRGALALWNKMSDRLPETRVEIVTGVAEANSIPWELLRDPKKDIPLALSAQAFVRAQPNAAGRAHLLEGEAGKVRILLVICRPKGGMDVPFRSVASRLVKGLDEVTREAYDLDVLRPPTFEQLGRVLRSPEAARGCSCAPAQMVSASRACAVCGSALRPVPSFPPASDAHDRYTHRSRSLMAAADVVSGWLWAALDREPEPAGKVLAMRSA